MTTSNHSSGFTWRYVALCAVLSLVLLAAKCRKSDAEKMQQIQEKTWLHSHEDDEGDVRVYRPNTFDFPPSRGRTGFTFEKDGTFKQYDIAPADGLQEKKGKWAIEADDKIKITPESKNAQPYVIEIISIKDDVLKIKRHMPEAQQ